MTTETLSTASLIGVPYVPELPIAKACDVAKLAIAPHKLNVDERALLRSSGVIAGLDAILCRCQQCKANYGASGAYWFDQQIRDRVLKRQTAFALINKGNSSGEAFRDNGE